MTLPLIFETDGPIARVTLNRPEAFNAMNAPLRDAFRDTFARIDTDPAIRVVILSGNGRGFCAGTDLSEAADSPVGMLIEREYRPLLNAIGSSPKLWIAQVHGSAAGIGAAFAMNCDMVTMAENATIYLAFAAIGLIPDGGTTWQLHRALGPRQALQTIVEGRRIPATEALDKGLINEVHAEAELAQRTTELALRLAASAPLATGAAKRLMRGLDGMSLSDAITAEAAEQGVLARSEDAREGISAFLQKRKPVFKGA